MSQQPEALKHAEWLERSLTIGAPEAAAELRRLHAVELEAIALRAQVERLQAEVNEQARLNGMGGERELALMARVERLQASTGANVDAGMVPFDLICNAIKTADDLSMEGDYMLDSNDCIAVVRVIQSLVEINGLTVGGIQASGRVGK